MKCDALKAELANTAKSFVDTLYVRPGEKALGIMYRLPTTKDITVRNAILRRKSLHDCLSNGKASFKLQINEVKTLYHRFSPRDKAVGQAFEKDVGTMVEDARIHYEVSIIDTSINDVLSRNTDLELGELTDQATTGKNLLTYGKLTGFLELTTFMLARMDWVGCHNIGTLYQMQREWEQKQIARGQSIGPAGSIVMPAILTKHPTTTIVGNNSGVIKSRFIPGVRMNTEASVFESEGRFYRLGMGGAHVPVPDLDAVNMGLTSIAEGTEDGDLAPDDSASQMAGRYAPGPGDSTYLRMLQRQRQDLAVPGADRGAGFW